MQTDVPEEEQLPTEAVQVEGADPDQKPEVSAPPEQPQFDQTDVNVLLTLSPDHMTLSLNASYPVEKRDAVMEEITLQLTNLGINEEELRQNARKHLTEHQNHLAQGAGESSEKDDNLIVINELILLKGILPEPPTDAKLDWARDFFNSEFVVNSDTGVMNYRQRLGNLSVSEGELLLSIIPPVEGKPGRDLLGKVIPPPKAKLMQVRTGSNVEFDKESLQYFAKKNGRIRYQKNGVLMVDDVFTISGDVGLKTGHIKHPGVLVVNGNIEPGSIVEASGDIEVSGYIEDAMIRCGGNLIVHGPIYGTDNTSIKIKEGLRAKFLKNARIEAQGDIDVQGSIEQCEVTTQGTVNVTNGRIVGGWVTALQGIAADQFGSDACIKTELSAGLDFSYQSEITIRTEEIKINQEKLKTVLNTLMQYKDRGKNLPELLQRRVAKLTGEARDLQHALKESQSLMEGLQQEAKAQEIIEIGVRKEAFPECTFHINGMEHTVKKYLTGPAYLVARENGIHISGTSVQNKKQDD